MYPNINPTYDPYKKVPKTNWFKSSIIVILSIAVLIGTVLGIIALVPKHTPEERVLVEQQKTLRKQHQLEYQMEQTRLANEREAAKPASVQQSEAIGDSVTEAASIAAGAYILGQFLR